MLLSACVPTAQAAVRNGGAYAIQSETTGLGSGASQAGVYGNEGAFGAVAGVSGISDTTASHGYLAQVFPIAGPEVLLGAPSGLSTVDMTLNGFVNPRDFATTAVFEYGPTSSYGSSASVALSPNNGTGSQGVSVVLPGLTPNTPYHYRLSATNVQGTNRTDDGIFIVTIIAQAPIVTAQPATDILSSTAKLGGLVNPNGYAATSAFEISTNGTNWTSIPALPSTVNGSSAVGVTANATGLEPNTLHRCRLVSNNAAGSTTSNEITFTSAVDPPLVIVANPSAITATGATFAGSVQTKNRATTVRFEYGTSTAYGSVTPDQYIPAGTAPVNLSASVSGLSTGVVYHYRIVASNSGGTAASANLSFVPVSGITPTAPPSVSSGSAFVMSLNLVLVIATVNPNGGATTLICEYGPSPAFGSSTPVIAAGNSNSSQLAFVSIENPQPGTLYHYRLVAQNSLGTSVGAASTFTTNFMPPLVEAGGVQPVGTTSARITGTVNPRGTNAQVFLDYGTDGVSFPNSVGALPATVSGSTEALVTADLTNLQQGVTYFYRLRGVNTGGTGLGTAGSFTPAILSGLTRQFPPAPPQANGSVTVNLLPAGILSGWRFAGERQWRASGTTAIGLSTGDRVIEFRPVPGHIQPPDEIAGVVSGAATQVLDRDYYETESPGTGGITVLLKPESLAAGNVPVAERAQWRFEGEGDGQWRDSGTPVNDLPVGSYLIECKPVAGRTTPPLSNVRVDVGINTLASVTYYLAPDPAGASPVVQTFASVSGNSSQPHGFVGQIRTSARLSSGFVVKPRVVATAGHVVFDDSTLTFVASPQWLFQRDKDIHEPKPLVPRGFYVFDGYAAQRQSENTPGVSSPQSQNLDVAAMYFTEEAARGGFSGFLASDTATNEFLNTETLKILIGYPVDGVAAADRGRMFATAPLAFSFTSGFGRTHSTNALRRHLRHRRRRPEQPRRIRRRHRSEQPGRCFPSDILHQNRRSIQPHRPRQSGPHLHPPTRPHSKRPMDQPHHPRPTRGSWRSRTHGYFSPGRRCFLPGHGGGSLML
jgi:hypothetical protein